jgi:hypothetical protein
LAFLFFFCRSQWPRGLRHELSPLTRTLGLWFRIQLNAWMSVRVYPVFVYVSSLQQNDPPSKESTDCPRIKKLKLNEAFQACPMLQSWRNKKRDRDRKAYSIFFLN